MKLTNCNAIITGANQGLGLAIAEAFVKEGASLSLCARNEKKLTAAVAHLRALAQDKQKIICRAVDVADEHAVQQFIDYSIRELGIIRIMVNNAGICGPKGKLDINNSEEWKQTIVTNLFGTMYFCKHILPHMQANKYGKIINIAGGGPGALPTMSAYVTSKAGVIRLTETLAKEYAPFHIDINAIAPGALNTRFLEEVLEAGPEFVDKAFYEKSVRQKKEGGVPLEKGAALCVYLASEESNGVSGKLISAVWDKWGEFQTHINDLQSTDVYTLRRIMPKERGLHWR
ncbi:MAG: SDR family oxidoreductase [archaeon]